MTLKFHDYNGTEVIIPDSAAFAEMVRSRRILPDTLLFDDTTALWTRASDYPEYHSALSSLQNAGAASYGAPLLGGLASFGQPAEEDRGRIWPLTLALGLLLGSLVFIGITLVGSSRSLVEALPRLLIVIGAAMGTGLISFLVWLVLLRNRKDMGLLFFSCCFLVICVAHYAWTAKQARARERAIAKVGATVSDLINGNRVEMSNIDRDTYGSLAPMVKILTEYSAQVSADFGEMKAELEALHLNLLLTSESTNDVAHIDDGRKRVHSMREVLDRYEERISARRDEMPSRVALSDMSEREKRSCLEGFENARPAGDQLLGEFFDIERAIANKLDETLTFLRGRWGRYKTTGNSIQFSSQRDIELYKAFVQELADLSEEEARWQARSREADLRWIKEIKKYAR